MKNKKLEIFLSCILVGLMVFWTVTSLVVVRKDCVTAKADSVITYYRFEGSNIILPSFYGNTVITTDSFSNWYMSSYANSYMSLKLSFDSQNFGMFGWTLKEFTGNASRTFDKFLYIGDNTVLTSFLNFGNSLNSTYGYYQPTNTNRWTYSQAGAVDVSDWENINSYFLFYNTGIDWYMVRSNTQSGGYYSSFFFGYHLDQYFNGLVCYIRLGSKLIEINSGTGAICNYVEYEDINGNKSIFYAIPYFVVLNNSFNVRYWEDLIDGVARSGNQPYGLSFIPFLSYRQYYTDYYINSIRDNQYAQGLEEGYNNGYANAINENQDTWYQSGFTAGQEIGDNIGYNRGYSQGANDAGTYTFLGLFGAVVDAPITAISGLLDFNLLGFNMLSFFYALMTLALIITVVRYMLGG